MTEHEKLETLTYVFDLLRDAAERWDDISSAKGQCNYCGEPECSLERPYCDPQKARRARRELDRLISPPLESLQPDRLTNPAERIYHEVWQKANERSPGYNHGFTMLEWILCPSGQKYPSPVSYRDAQVATSIVQFLGTNGGHSLIHKAETLIEQERAERLDIERVAINIDPAESDPSPKLDEWAHIIASMCRPVTHMGCAPLETVIRTALYKAYRAGRREAENFVCGTA
jgi:hypothetical protein